MSLEEIFFEGFRMNYNELRDQILEFEKSNEFYITLVNRPKRKSMVLCGLEKDYTSDSAIVVQGPVVKEDNFTVETCNMYCDFYPEAKIILSTWDEDIDDILLESIDSRVVLVRNKKPENPGFRNIFNQSHSTMSGINEAEESGCNYVLKTRSDQRIYKPQILIYFKSVLTAYPVLNQNQKERILLLDQVGKKYLPYFYSDILQFGFVSDIKKYWNLYEDDRNFSEYELNSTRVEDFLYLSNSAYIAKSYLSKQIVDLDYTIRQSWNLLIDLFYVVGKSEIDLYWYQGNPSTDKGFLAYSANDPKRKQNRTRQRLQEFREKNYFDKYLINPFTNIDWHLMKLNGVEKFLPEFEFNDIKDLDKLHGFNAGY